MTSARGANSPEILNFGRCRAPNPDAGHSSPAARWKTSPGHNGTGRRRSTAQPTAGADPQGHRPLPPVGAGHRDALSLALAARSNTGSGSAAGGQIGRKGVSCDGAED
jgi:hypothetical protein